MKTPQNRYEVIAYSDEFIYVLDKEYLKLTSWQLNHSPEQIANDFASLPKVKNFEYAEQVLVNMMLEQGEDIMDEDW